MQLQENVLGPFHHTVLSTLDGLADAHLESGSCVKALKFYFSVLDRLGVAGQDRKGGNCEVKSCHDGASIGVVGVGKGELRITDRRRSRAAAIVFYKMSRAHIRQNDLEASIQCLRTALFHVKGLGAKNLEDEFQDDIDQLLKQFKERELYWI